MSKTVRAFGLASAMVLALCLAGTSQSRAYVHLANLGRSGTQEHSVSAAAQGTFYSTQDTTVLEYMPDDTTDYLTEMGAGSVVYTPGASSPARSLVGFGQFSLPYGQEILQGTLRLHVYSCDDLRATYGIETYLITSAWTEDATWNTQPSRGSLLGTLVLPNDATGWYDFDVTEFVQHWYSGTQTNYGIMVGGPEDPEGACYFSTRESAYAPELVVDYQALPPQPTSISPDSGQNSGSVNGVVVTGDYFQSGATVKLARSGQPDIPAGNVVVVDRTQITCDLDLTGAAGGQWDVVVTNPGGLSGTLAGGFTVEWTPPQVHSISPNSGPNDGPISITDLVGDHFRQGAAVKLLRSGQPDIQAANVVVVSASRITCDLDLTGVAAGAWDVQVTNPEGQSATLAGGFTVEWAPPQVHSITPSGGTNDGPISITDLAGDYFLPGATVKLAHSGQPDILASSVVVVDRAQITCDLELTGVAAGSWDVQVTNPDGLSGTLAGGFTVGSAPPQVHSISPNRGLGDGPISITDLAGDHFRQGATVKLLRAGQPDIHATNVVVVSASQITCDLDLTGAAAGPWDVVVTNPDGLSGTLAGGFTVEWAPPQLHSITPSGGTNDGPISITDLAGDHFRQGAAVKLLRAGQPDIWATNVVVSASRITCDLDLTGAAVGRWEVVVINPDGQAGILASGFIVSQAQFRIYLPLALGAYSGP